MDTRGLDINLRSDPADRDPERGTWLETLRADDSEPSEYLTHDEAPRLLEAARDQLRQAYRTFLLIDRDVPVPEGMNVWAARLGRAQGLAFSGAVSIAAHMEHIQRDPIGVDGEGGDHGVS